MLSATLQQMLAKPAVVERILAAGAEPTPSDVATCSAVVTRQLEVWGARWRTRAYSRSRPGGAWEARPPTGAARNEVLPAFIAMRRRSLGTQRASRQTLTHRDAVNEAQPG